MKQAGGRAPRILRVAWGRMDVEGLGSGRDFKLWPGGGRAWDWNETGTRHAPGIQPADVEELIAHLSRVIVLSRGMALRLAIAPETIGHLESQGIAVHVEATKRAVEIYNQLADSGQMVGGLFHSTC